jgi:hypothetical protein
MAMYNLVPLIAQSVLKFAPVPTTKYPFSKSRVLPSSNVPGSSVGIATGYGLGGPGIESRW